MIFLRIDFVLNQDNLTVREPNTDVNTPVGIKPSFSFHAGPLNRRWAEV